MSSTNQIFIEFNDKNHKIIVMYTIVLYKDNIVNINE